MLNQEIYSKNPATSKLVNEGVANVNDDGSQQAADVLRYELETFVCDGQYQHGLERILDTYLRNIDKAQQPAVWVSGFYGSGKSHLVKMLRAFWVDTKFADGTTARSVADLPDSIVAKLKELSTAGRRHGGLHAAAGTLGASAVGSVRLALLSIVFKSVGLPERYPLARFVMWLKSEGIYDQVRQHVEEHGYVWQEELDFFYVAEGLREALVAVKPSAFPDALVYSQTLNNLYPNVTDISNAEMTKAMNQALSGAQGFPLTLIVLDEVQQFIGQDDRRSLEVQEVVETCCKYFEGKLLFVGTGQTAITGTPNLEKLEGRFTVRVELTDVDVDAVVRKVVLAKKPGSVKALNDVLQQNLGEVTRHLSDTGLRHQEIDLQHFAPDYPILPIRRRFWEATLRSLDRGGTDSQLRNRLSMAHKAIRTNLDKPLGSVLPADYLYFDVAHRMLQAGRLPRELHEKTLHWLEGSADERLLARACGLIYLINQLTDSNQELGIRATTDCLADLMVEDLASGSADLRIKLPTILDSCSQVIKVKDEYRIQTKESAAWNDAFRAQRGLLLSESYRIEADRSERMKRRFSELVKRLAPVQGLSKEPRELHPVFDSRLPSDHASRVYIWARASWNSDERTVRADALQAGPKSPTIFVFIPQDAIDNLRNQLADFQAASSTLEKRGIPSTSDGVTARAYIETIKQRADQQIEELLATAFANARVFLGGGQEVAGTDLLSMLKFAAESAFVRLYPRFDLADNPSWAKVYEKAKSGAPDALKQIGYDGAVEKYPVCKEVLGFLAGGKKGQAVRTHFSAPDFGWPGDAVDGALQVLATSGQIRVQDDHGNVIAPTALERKQIGRVTFRLESVVLTTPDRIKARKLLQKLGVQAKADEELSAIPEFLRQLETLAASAGGDAPRPLMPDTALITDLRLAAGNEAVLALSSRYDEYSNSIDRWTDLTAKIKERMIDWDKLQTLLGFAPGLAGVQALSEQVDAINRDRLLLMEPNPVQPLLAELQASLRSEYNRLQLNYLTEYNRLRDGLFTDSNWQALGQFEQKQILLQVGLELPVVEEVGNYADLQAALRQRPLRSWHDRIDALAGRFARAREQAAKATEPKVKPIDISRSTLRTAAEVEDWIAALRERLLQAVVEGPVILR